MARRSEQIVHKFSLDIGERRLRRAIRTEPSSS